MKRLTLLAITLTLALGVGSGRALATDPPEGPVRITNFGKKAPVTFDHAKHGDAECAQCHHKQDEGEFKCGQCHDLEVQAETPKIKDAMHKKDSGKCYACHFGSEPQAKKLKCAECHVKR